MLQLVGKTIKFLRDKCRTNNSLEFISLNDEITEGSREEVALS